MKFKITILFFFLLLSSTVYSNKLEEIDKLYVTNSALAQSRIEHLRQKCERDGYIEFTKSRLEIVYSYILSYRHEPALAIKHANIAFETATKEKNNENQLSALQLLIENELNLGFDKLAVNHIYQMKSIAERSSDYLGFYFIPTSLKYLAMSYSRSNNIDKSIELIDQALKISKNSDNRYILFYELSFQKAKCYLDINDYKQAAITYKIILNHLESDSKYKRGHIDKAGYDINYLETHSQLALVYLHLGQNEKANIAFDEAIKLYKTYPDVPEVKNRIARYLSLTSQYNQLNKFVEPLIDTNIKSKDMLELMELLLKSYILEGKADKSKILYEKCLSMSDSIKIRTSGCALEEMNIAYNTYKLQKKLQLQHAYLIFGTVIVFLLTFIVIIAIIYNKRLTRLYKSARNKIDEFMASQEKVDFISDENTNEMYKELFLRLDERIKEDKPYLNNMFGRDNLATYAKLDKNKLTDVIKCGSKVTPNKYLNQLRIAYSVELLKSKPEYSIESIANDSGFGNRTTFYRVFTDAFGITPVQYRRVLKMKQLLSEED